MQKFKLLYLFTLGIIFIGCKDNSTTTPTPMEIEDEWPTFVDTGANVVAYKVNGKIRVTKNISKLDSNRGYMSCFYFLHQQYKRFAFEGNRISDETFEIVEIDIADAKDTGLYIIGGSTFLLNGGYYSSGTNENTAKQYATNEFDSGYIVITKIDTIRGVITGRFEFNGQYVFGTEKKKITGGRFDLKYYR